MLSNFDRQTIKIEKWDNFKLIIILEIRKNGMRKRTKYLSPEKSFTLLPIRIHPMDRLISDQFHVSMHDFPRFLIQTCTFHPLTNTFCINASTWNLGTYRIYDEPLFR